MTAEHRRPLVALFLVAVVCALGLGNAAQQGLPTDPTEVVRADRVPVPRLANVAVHDELVGESQVGLFSARRLRTEPDRPADHPTPRRARATAQAGSRPEVREAPAVVAPEVVVASGPTGTQDARQEGSSGPTVHHQQRRSPATVVQRDPVRTPGRSGAAPGQARRGGSATGRGALRSGAAPRSRPSRRSPSRPGPR